MSLTLATLKSTVQNYLETDEATFVANLNTFIENVEDRILKSVQLPNQRKNVDGLFTSSSRFLTTPTDFLAPFSLAVIDSNSYYYLDLKHNSFIKEFAPSTSTTGRPRYYAIFDDNTFEVAPKPDQNYTAELHYLAKPPSLTTQGDTGTTWLSINAEETLLYGTLIEGAIYLKLPADYIAQYEVRFKESLARLKNLGEGRDTRDEMRYDSLRINVS